MRSMPSKLPIAVLISGSGSNLQALIDAADDPSFGCAIVGVISDQPDAYGLERAGLAGIPARVIEWTRGDTRADFTARLVSAAHDLGAEALVLAGFMRILAPTAIEAFPNAIINVHPAMLPAFAGAHAIEQALEAGVSETGVTVHFVDELVDHGPIITQEPVPVLHEDTVDSLRTRIQQVEHRLLPAVVSAFGRGAISVEGTTVRWRTEEVAS